MDQPIQYLKEYTSYNFQFFHNHTLPSCTVSLTLKGPFTSSKTQLPHYLIDSQEDQEFLYILKWKINSTTNSYLDIFEFKEKGFRRIGFNVRPSLICIASGLIYLVAAQEMYVLDSHTLAIINTFNIGNDELFSLEPAFLGSGQKQKGAILYSWNSKAGLTKKTFTRNNGENNSRWSFAKNLLKKADKQQYGNLKVIIPNVIGLLFHHFQQQILVVNLTDMKVVSHSSLKLQDNCVYKAGSVIIKYEHCIRQGFDDSLIVGIGDRDSQFINIFQINLVYSQQLSKKYLGEEQTASRKPPISSFTNGNIVEWEKTEIKQAITVCVEGRMVDFIINDTGLIYFSQNPPSIPISNYIKFASPQYHHPILPLEHNICRLYLKDYNTSSIDFRNKYFNGPFGKNQENLINSVLAPNRYTIPFILATLGIDSTRKINPYMLEPRKLLLSWYKAYKPKSIIKFNNDIIIIRESSLSTLLPISKEQYVLEVQCGEELMRHFRESGSLERSEGISFISKQSSKFDEMQVHNGQQSQKNLEDKSFKDDLAFGAEKNHLIQEQNMDEDGEESKKSQKKQDINIFNKYFSQIYLLASKKLKIQQETGSVEDIKYKSSVLAQTLLQNRIKDTIDFYFRVLNRTFMGSTSDRQNYMVQILLIHYLRFLSNIQNTSLEMVIEFGTDFITYLINKYLKIDSSKPWVNIDAHTNQFISSLFMDLMPIKSQKVDINNMVKELIILSTHNVKFCEKILLQLFDPQNFNLYPYTHTVLAGICSLPIEFDFKHRFINSFILHQIEKTKSFNENANKIMQEFKEMIRFLPNSDIRSYKDLVQQSLVKLGGRDYQPKHSSSNENEYISDFRSSYGLQALDAGLQIDFWKLIRMSDSQDLENALLQRDYNSIFQIKESVVNSTDQEQAYSNATNDDILAAWVFLYRYYVQKLSIILQTASSQKYNYMKREIYQYATSAQECLFNVSEYYRKCYKRSAIPSQSHLIHKVCSQMIGLDPLTVYPSIPANSDILEIITLVSSREESEFEVFSQFKNVAFVYISYWLEFHQREEPLIRELQKLNQYISKKEINQMISVSSKLRRLYEELSQETRSILGYCDINELSSKPPFRAVNFRNAYVESILQK